MSNDYCGVGRAAQAYFLKTGGTNYATSGFYVTADATGSGRVDMVGGEIRTGGFSVNGGTGQVYQSGGSVYVSGVFDVGGPSGYYEITTGAVLVADTFWPFTGVGTFRQGGGYVQTRDFRMGSDGRSLFSHTGRYELVSGLMTNTAVFEVARFKTATFRQTGGTNISPGGEIGVLRDDAGVGANGRYEMGGGYWDCRGELFAGLDLGCVGAVSQSGGTINVAGNIWLGNAAGSTVRYDLTGGLLRPNGFLIIGNSGSGSFIQTGGTNEWLTASAGLVVGWTTGSTGVYQLAGGTLAISNGTFYVARSGAGTFLIGTNNGTGTIDMRGNNCPLSIRQDAVAGEGIVRGWGALPFVKIQNSGKVIADGYGQARDLDFSGSAQGVEENYQTPVTGGGWYAVNKGRLLINRVANASTIIWGDGAVQDLVNSVKFVFTGQSGSLTGQLLATDRSDVPGGVIPIAVWNFNGFSSFSTATVTIKYDDTASLFTRIGESELNLYRYNGSVWVNITGSLDTVNNLIASTSLNVSDGALTYFAVGCRRFGTTLSFR